MLVPQPRSTASVPEYGSDPIAELRVIGVGTIERVFADRPSQLAHFVRSHDIGAMARSDDVLGDCIRDLHMRVIRIVDRRSAYKPNVERRRDIGDAFCLVMRKAAAAR